MNPEEVDDIIKDEEIPVEEEETGEKIPNNPNYWFNRILKQHPEILSMKERVRSFGRPQTSPPGTIPPSYGRDYLNSAFTETSEAIPPTAVMQLILNYLHEEGFTQARDMLLIEAKEQFPELLDSMCYQPQDLPPRPPLSKEEDDDDDYDEEGEKEKKEYDKEENSKDDIVDNNSSSMVFANNLLPESHKPFNEKVLTEMYHKALVPLLQLGAGKTDMTDLFAIPEGSGGSSGSSGGNVSGAPGDKNSANVVVEGSEKTNEEIDQEVEAVEEYTTEITFDDDEEEDKDENVWDEVKKEGENVIFSNDIFVAGTLNQMINWLTEPANQERSYTNTFLQTYPLVVTADKLMAKLIQRYNIPLGRQESDQEKCILALKFIKIWIEKYPGDITGSVHDLLSYFLRVNTEKKNTTRQFNELNTTFMDLDGLKARRAAQYSLTEEDIQPTRCEPSNVPRNIFSPKLSLDDIDEKELTRQFYVIDYVMFWRIQPRELIGRNWALHPERAPNVNRMLARMHRVTRWTQLCILQGYWSDAGAANPDHLKMLGKFISLGVSLMAHMDFFSAWAIYLGIKSKAVYSVMKMAESVKREPNDVMVSNVRRLSTTFSINENYSAYRVELKKHPQRSIPALSIHLNDLALVDESIPTILRGDLINYQKLAFTSSIIGKLFPHKEGTHSYQYIDQIAALIKNVDADPKVIQQLAEAGLK